MNILYQFNEKYAPYAGVSITSLFENNREVKEIYVYVLGEDLSKKSQEKFKKLAGDYEEKGKIRRVEFIGTDKLVSKMKALNMPTYRGSYAANMRLFVGDVIEEIATSKIHRLLYLDADTIVTGNLKEMYSSKIKTLGMVYDTLAGDHKYSIGLGSEDGYYNSGVILIDVDKWLANDFTGRIVEHVQKVRAQYPSPDQDLINVVVRDEISPLPVSCNFQPHLRDYSYVSFMKAFAPYPFYSGKEVAAASGEPAILHAFRYLGQFCWHKHNLHPFNYEFNKYLRKSPWKDYVKEKVADGPVMKAERLMYRLLPKDIFLQIFRLAHKGFYNKADAKSKENKISKAM